MTKRKLGKDFWRPPNFRLVSKPANTHTIPLLGEILTCWVSYPPSVHQARINEIINKRIALRYAPYRWKTQSGVSHSHILRSESGPRFRAGFGRGGSLI